MVIIKSIIDLSTKFSRKNRELSLKDIPYVFGLASPIVSYVGIFLAANLTSEFTWTGKSLSWLGETTSQYNFLFNTSIKIGAVIGIPFALMLLAEGETRLKKLSALLLTFSLLGLLGVGTFHLDIDPSIHLTSATVFFMAATFSMFVWGSGVVLEGRPRWGLVVIWLGVLQILGWAIYSIQAEMFGANAIQGIAIPESHGSTLFGIWVVSVARRKLGYEAIKFE